MRVERERGGDYFAANASQRFLEQGVASIDQFKRERARCLGSGFRHEWYYAVEPFGECSFGADEIQLGHYLSRQLDARQFTPELLRNLKQNFGDFPLLSFPQCLQLVVAFDGLQRLDEDRSA